MRRFMELLDTFGIRQLLYCPQCGCPEINRADQSHEEVMLIFASKGIVLPIRCGNGHTWKLRVSSWWEQAPDADIVWERQRREKLRKLQASPAPARSQPKPKRGRNGKPLPDRAFKSQPGELFQ